LLARTTIPLDRSTSIIFFVFFHVIENAQVSRTKSFPRSLKMQDLLVWFRCKSLKTLGFPMVFEAGCFGAQPMGIIQVHFELVICGFGMRDLAGIFALEGLTVPGWTLGVSTAWNKGRLPCLFRGWHGCDGGETPDLAFKFSDQRAVCMGASGRVRGHSTEN
jgi:hypothetical protein